MVTSKKSFLCVSLWFASAISYIANWLTTPNSGSDITRVFWKIGMIIAGVESVLDYIIYVFIFETLITRVNKRCLIFRALTNLYNAIWIIVISSDGSVKIGTYLCLWSMMVLNLVKLVLYFAQNQLQGIS